jgi:antibiotic biosynthesis monooxygenase (ABM) superfamily enzyme
MSEQPSTVGEPVVTIIIEVVLMTWWVMPWITRRLAGLIYPAHKIS